MIKENCAIIDIATYDYLNAVRTDLGKVAEDLGIVIIRDQYRLTRYFVKNEDTQSVLEGYINIIKEKNEEISKLKEKLEIKPKEIKKKKSWLNWISYP